MGEGEGEGEAEGDAGEAALFCFNNVSAWMLKIFMPR